MFLRLLFSSLFPAGTASRAKSLTLRYAQWSDTCHIPESSVSYCTIAKTVLPLLLALSAKPRQAKRIRLEKLRYKSNKSTTYAYVHTHTSRTQLKYCCCCSCCCSCLVLSLHAKNEDRSCECRDFALCTFRCVCVCVCKRVATFRLFLWIGMLNVVQGEWKVLLSGNVKKNLDLTRVFAYVWRHKHVYSCMCYVKLILFARV